MKTDDSGDVEIGKLVPGIGGLGRNEVCYLGESVDNHPYGIMSSIRLGQSSNEIHSDFFPRPFWNLERLEQSSGALVLCLDSLANIALSNIGGNFPLHSMPPKDTLQILVHFSASRVNGVCRLVSFLQNLLL